MSSRKNHATPKATISAVLIVKNEEKILDRCLAALTWTDEIIVYDTGSTDATVDIARRYTDHVFEGYWDDDFAAARNRALDHATSEWVISVDADEEFDGSPRELRRLLTRIKEPRAMVRVVNLSGDRLQASNDFQACRLFRREQVRWSGRIHEQPIPIVDTSVGRPPLSSATLLHSGYAAEVFEEKDKINRNIELARSAVDDAIAADDPTAVANARAQLARTILGFTGDAEGLEVAEAAWLPDLLSPLMITEMCRTVIDLHLAHQDSDAARVWIDRWRSVQALPECDLAAARAAAIDGDPHAVVEFLDRLPEHDTKSLGLTFHRTSIVGFEVSNRLAAGQDDLALVRLQAAVREDKADVNPIALIATFGADTMYRLAAQLGTRTWRLWALQCANHECAESLDLLSHMQAQRPDDLTVVVCASHLHRLMSLEQATEWTVRLKGFGADDDLPLLSIATDTSRAPRERAIAAALLLSAFDDERAAGPLAAALTEIPPEQESALVAELDIVAPGLVTAG